MATRKEESGRDERAQAWYIKPIDDIFEQFRTGVDGLSQAEAKARLDRYGLNKLVEDERVPVWRTVLHQFKNPLIYILLIAATITILLRDYIDAGVILTVVILNAVIGFVQEYKAEESVRSLKKLLALKAFVVRDGFEQDIDAEFIVPGDIVTLQSGRKVPADIRLYHVKEFQIDESAFTGESVPVSKTAEAIPRENLQAFEQTNIVFMGSIVTAGRAAGVVVATGRATQLGQISEDVRAVGAIKTPLQGRIDALSKFIIIIVAGSGIAGLGIGLAQGEDIVQLLLTMIAMAVAIVPEGLPVALTIALAVAVNRMARQKAIIRYLPAIETIGSSTVIGSDKTGTLTRNEMSVQKIWAGGGGYSVEGTGYEPIGLVTKNDAEPKEAVDLREDEILEWTLRIGLLAGESELIKKEDRWVAHGDPTEVSLMVAAFRAGMDEEREKHECPQLDMVPFESELQYMATLNKVRDKVFILVKGAPEKLLSLSKTVAGVEGGAPIDKKDILVKADEFADRGLRVLGMALKEVPPATTEVIHKDVFDLTFIGLQGMMDPPRPQAVEAIKSAEQAGIRVIMITGDNARTALSIGGMMGIAGETDVAVTGRELDDMSEDQLRDIVKTVPVFARVSPHHKLRIVNALKANGEIVAVTGDGVNDAAALKAAHIGAAMGITGTDVAKEASDMVIVDDNFASIYRALIEGRVAFDNIRKVTFFLLTTGAGILIAILAAIVTGYPLMFLPAQILWMNLVTNGLQDVALAFDPKEPGVEERPPRDPREGVLNRTLLLRLALLGVVVGLSSYAVFVSTLNEGASLEHARTMALTTIVFAQFFHVVNSRSERLSAFKQNLADNKFLLFSMLAALVAQLSLLYVPTMRLLFRTTALSFEELAIAVVVGSTVLAASELDKWRVRHSERRVASP
ncbi:MAG: HAD-IC family P-type ATPase [Actinobacteria bacterium]|nr:HAD-IC family P-type ATPase [Actinomycetota bacterium]